MTADAEWGVFLDAKWDGGIVHTGHGYVVRRMDDPRPPYCHMNPTHTYATERRAERAAARLTSQNSRNSRKPLTPSRQASARDE